MRARSRGGDGLSRFGRPLTRIDDRTTTDLTTLAVERRRPRTIETCRRIRVIDPNARVAMITARSETSVMQEALEAGAADFITKPFNLDWIGAALNRLGRTRSESRTPRAGAGR